MQTLICQYVGRIAYQLILVRVENSELFPFFFRNDIHEQQLFFFLQEVDGPHRSQEQQ